MRNEGLAVRQKQTRFKANQSQFWPKNWGGKANSNPNKSNWSEAKVLSKVEGSFY
jgi:hypothetical protein